MGDLKWMTQIRRGTLELCILSILARGRRYGYDIVQALSSADGLVIPEGTIYPLLSRLRNEGLVVAEWQASPQGPKRKYYTLTDQGHARLEGMRLEWERFVAEVDRIIDAETSDAPEVEDEDGRSEGES